MVHYSSDVDAFARSHIDYRYIVVPAYQQYKWLCTLHVEATQVFQRLLRLCETDSLVPTANNTDIPQAPSQLLSIVWKPPTPNKPHPIQLHHDRATADDIKKFYRLAMRLLPVRSRFSFLREAHPQIIYCIRDGCSAVETERHLFFECVLPSELWPVMFRDWSSFFTYTPKWIDIVLGRRPTPTDGWKEHITMLGDLWQIMRAIVLHFVWTVRNDCLFRQRAPTPLLPALRVIYTTFSAHVD
uniref:Reverse transcriptase zinc-binding domain-containing protein n=1 Tax=Globisporangium ultimum (strain ATCC 200006 / CBS 805.95 / DAOM BR144) TaxID=431595 RepID=K3X6Y9_GLOUD